MSVLCEVIIEDVVFCVNVLGWRMLLVGFFLGNSKFCGCGLGVNIVVFLGVLWMELIGVVRVEVVLWEVIVDGGFEFNLVIFLIIGIVFILMVFCCF